jgi:hypothetical protein
LIERYSRARALGAEVFRQAVEEDTQLLEYYGMRLLSVEGGIRMYSLSLGDKKRVNPWDVVHIAPKVWSWARPLLMELRERRARNGVPAPSVACLQGELLSLGSRNSTSSRPTAAMKARKPKGEG